MPIAFAFVISVALHGMVVALDGWTLPEDDAPPAPMQAVLVSTSTAPAVSAAPAAAPAAAARRAPRVRPAPLPPEAAALAEPAVVPVPAEPLPAEPLPVADAAAASAPEQAPEAAPVAEPMPAAAPPAPAVVVRLAPRGSVRYAIHWGERNFAVGALEHRWTREGERYRLTSEARTTGIAAVFKPLRDAQESEGRIDAGGLHPLRFRHEQVKRTLTAEFDREQGVVRNGARADPLGEWAATAQDLLSMYYQLVMRVAATPEGEALPAAIDLPIASGRKLAVYRFEPVARETLATPLGEVATLHLRAKNREDQIDLWVAPERFELPLRVRLVDRKGEVFEQMIEQFEREELP